jgi:parallel beta-helix repeat protein
VEVTQIRTQPTIIGNVISNATTGICIAKSTPAEVSGNELSGNDVGVSLRNTDATVKDGVITGDGRGVSVSGTGSPSIVNNDIDVGGIGISLAKGNDAEVSGNTVCGGEGSIVVLDGATPEIGDNETCD